MTKATYETVLEQAQRLTPEEQMRLREDLPAPSTGRVQTMRGSGAALVTFLRAMERVIQDGCEAIDARDW